MDSSPDLSLKLRRGSNDSRDSFYMDFAQGIDSDIEEVSTIVTKTIISTNVAQQKDYIISSLNTPAIELIMPRTVQSPCLPLETELPPLRSTSTYLESPIVQRTTNNVTENTQEQSKYSVYSKNVSNNEVNYVKEGEECNDVILSSFPSHQIFKPLQEAESVVCSETDIFAEVINRNIGIPLPSIVSVATVPINDETPFPTLPFQSTTKLEDDKITVMNIPDSGQYKRGKLPMPVMYPVTSNSLSEFVSHSASIEKKSKIFEPITKLHHVTVDDPKLSLSTSSTHHQLIAVTTDNPPSPVSNDSSNQQLASTTNMIKLSEGEHKSSNRHKHHLSLLYQSHHNYLHNYPGLSIAKKSSRLQSDSILYANKKIKAGDALATTFSALYGKLLVVMGIAFPMAEVISTYIPPSFYEGFYLYLYCGSMSFLFFMYATMIWSRPEIISTADKASKKYLKQTSTSGSGSVDESDTESYPYKITKKFSSPSQVRRPSLLQPLGRQHHYGSFYLRMGAVAFGIGSMIYSGLEFGQYFELERDTKCHNVMLALTPATRMAFIFIQMYFIFLNNEQIKVYHHKVLARFGLMHMIGTNLSVWLNVLIQETKHEILTFYNPENRTLRISHRLGNRIHNLEHQTTSIRAIRGLKGPYQIFECRRTNIIGTLVQDASPFLFPCTIEYSLICAAILYVMWRSISRPEAQHTIKIESGLSTCKRSPHHYSVDCARAHKGLFIGILILVLTIISLILFFVLISRPEFVSLAVTEVTICELTIYATATIATLIGMVQIRHLQFDAARSFELDDILLVGAQTGSFLYSTFTVIGGHFTLRRDTILVLITALASIVQTAFQTMFILDASRRQAVGPEHIRKKPGREIVTFMLVANLAMWAISTLEKSRAESHPIQLNFYGLWAWTIITHVSMPLAIFYRFHSTVCLCEIWKRAYKLKPTYM